MTKHKKTNKEQIKIATASLLKVFYGCDNPAYTVLSKDVEAFMERLGSRVFNVACKINDGIIINKVLGVKKSLPDIEDYYCVLTAINNGHFDIAKAIYEHGKKYILRLDREECGFFEDLKSEIFSAIIQSKSKKTPSERIELLKYFINDKSVKIDIPESSLEQSLSGKPPFEIAEFLIKEAKVDYGCETIIEVVESAILDKKIDVLKFLESTELMEDVIVEGLERCLSNCVDSIDLNGGKKCVDFVLKNFNIKKNDIIALAVKIRKLHKINGRSRHSSSMGEVATKLAGILDDYKEKVAI